MPRNNRVRRVPNREPTSLAVTTTTALGNIEALDLDPSQSNYPSISRHSTPPTLTPPIPTEYPDLNIELDVGYIYPNSLPISQGLEVSWSPIPPSPPSPPPPSPPPPPLSPSLSIENVTILNNIQPIISFKWTLELEELLFHTLIEQVNIGKRADSGFKKEAWIACCNAVNSTLATIVTPVTIDKCKGKVDIMKGLWREFIWLKDQSGFGFDEATGLIKAGEQAWSDIIKVKPKLRWHRTNKLNHFETLTTLFSLSSATGAFARSSTSINQSTPSIASSQGASISRIRTRGLPIYEDVDSEGSRKRFKSSSAIETEAIGWIISVMKEKHEDGEKRHYNKVEMAIELLQSEYKTRLSVSHFVMAMNFLTIEAQASAFITVNDSQIRDIWLCQNIDVELI